MQNVCAGVRQSIYGLFSLVMCTVTVLEYVQKLAYKVKCVQMYVDGFLSFPNKPYR